MKRHFARRVFALATLAALAWPALLSAPVLAQTASTNYAVTDLGSLSAARGTRPFAINNGGQVAGDATAASGNGHAFLWTPTTPNGTTGVMRDLGLPSRYTYATARGINDSGQVVGWGGGGQTALLWSGGAIYSLGSLSGSGGSVAYAINRSGEVTGSAGTSSGEKTFLWKPSSPNGVKGKMYDIGQPGLGANWGMPPYTYGFNASGQIVNENFNFLWTPTAANATTGTAVGAPWGPSAINDLGQTTGNLYTGGIYNDTQAQYWDPVKDLIALGFPINTVLPAGYAWASSYSVWINNGTTLVGTAVARLVGVGSYDTVWVWSAAAGMLDLNVNASVQSSGWVLTTVCSLNDKGQIIGVGTYNGAQRAFLLTPQ